MVKAAELLWQVFAAGSSTAAAAERMLQNVKSSPLGSGSCLGRSAWNAYSLNIDYRTGICIVTLVHWFDPSCFVIVMHACAGAMFCVSVDAPLTHISVHCMYKGCTGQSLLQFKQLPCVLSESGQSPAAMCPDAMGRHCRMF